MALTDDNIILNMPFDEPKGSEIAYDFSKNRADGIVTDSNFVQGKQGNCIEFTGIGNCHIPYDIIPVEENFTILAWIKRKESPDVFSGKKIGFWFAWNEIEGFREKWIDLNEEWNYIAIVKEGLTAKIYLNIQLIDTVELPVQPTGFAILQDIFFTESGFGLVDEVKAYNVALTQDEITDSIIPAVQLSYKINGIDFKNWDVTVSDSNGILDLPRLKTPFSLDWKDYHGDVVDLTRKRIEAREITLDCWMKAEGKLNFITKLNSFLETFRADGTQRLMIDLHPIKPLLYEVYNMEGIAISKRWRDDLMVGTFTLNLVEPDPVKRIVRHWRTSDAVKTLTVTFSSIKPVTIYWGDGTHEKANGNNITRTHSYNKDGIYYAIIAGVIEEIKDFSTSGIVIWHKI